MTTFKYKDKIISTPNLEKKLKRMKLTLDDIEIIQDPIKKEKPVEEEFTFDIPHYYYIDKTTGYKYLSIYDNLPYEQITREEYYERTL